MGFWTHQYPTKGISDDSYCTGLPVQVLSEQHEWVCCFEPAVWLPVSTVIITQRVLKLLPTCTLDSREIFSSKLRTVENTNYRTVEYGAITYFTE